MPWPRRSRTRWARIALLVLGALLAVPIAIVANVLVHELWFRRLGGDPDSKKETP